MTEEKKYNPLALLSIHRPVFITCIIFLILFVGWMSIKKLPVNLFPQVDFPIVFVQTIYPGAGPKEIEQNISKVIEEELSSVVGLKRLSSISREGLSIVICEFRLKSDIKDAEQQVRDRLGVIKVKLPDEVDMPTIKRLDPADLPIATLTFKSDMEEKYLADIMDDLIRPSIEQLDGVSMVKAYGVRKREIRVELNQKKLKSKELSAEQVMLSLMRSGVNIPAGTVNLNAKEEGVFRTLGEYSSIAEIGKTIVTFRGNDIPITVSEVGTVQDSLEDEKSRTYLNGNKTVTIDVYKQSSANTVKVVKNLEENLEAINKSILERGVKGEVSIVRDGAHDIRANVVDVQ